MPTSFAPRDRQGFEIAIICALPLEANAVIALFDHHWEDEEQTYGRALGDPNAYTTGVIGKHNVVVAHMPGMGKVSAAGVAVGLRISFPNIKLALVVGICGGVPFSFKNHHHHHQSEKDVGIYLGDVVISQCLVQYDFGRQYPKVFETRDTTEQGGLGKAPGAIQSMLRKLETDHHARRLQEDTCKLLKELQGGLGRAVYPGAEFDRLFKPSYLHKHRVSTDCEICLEDGMQVCPDALEMTCRELGCEEGEVVHRERPDNREGQDQPVLVFPPSIHIGKMGSGDTVMKSGTHRDQIAMKDGIIAFEMEGAGVSAQFPSLVIKGVCDYADSHKNKQWQDYAAATAAACTKAFLKSWTLDSAYDLNMSALSLKPIFMVDITRDDPLVGREDLMLDLTRKLSKEGHNRVALVALGGMGKTRIALEYALTLRNTPVSVFWIHASSKVRILDSYAKIARKVNIIGYKGAERDDPLLVKEWFESEASGHWHIILDNADDHDLLYGPSRLADILPRSENGSILMTTRDKNVGLDFAGASRLLRVQPLNSDQAQKLLVSKFDDDENEIDLESCKTLCDELEGIPLAIVQASAFMHQNSITVEEYLDQYQESSGEQIKLLSEDFEDSLRDRDSNNPVATTWFISFDYIEKRIPLAGELLRRMAMVDSQAIPVSLIQTQESRYDLIKALGTLQAFCLITARVSPTRMPKKKNDKSYDLHRLVRLAVRNWLRQRDLLYLQTARTLKLVSHNYPDIEKTGWTEIDTCRAYLPHAVALLSSDELKATNKDVAPVFRSQWMVAEHAPDDVPCAICAANLMMKLSFTFDYSEYMKKSIKWALQAVSLRTFIFGDEHQCTIETLIRAATTYYNVGQTQSAREFGEKAVRLIDATDQPAPSLIAWKLEIIAFVQDEDGSMPIEYFRKALDIRTEIFGPDNADVLRTKENLSSVYFIHGRYDESDELIREVIESHTRISGPASPGTLRAMLYLAFTYASTGRGDEAIALNTQISTLEAANTLGVREAAETSMVLIYRLMSYYRLGRYTEAADLSRQILELDSEINDRGSFDFIVATRMLAACYSEKQHNAEAEKLRIKVVECATKLAGRKSAYAITSMKELADFYKEEERYKKAEPLMEEVVELEIEKFGSQSPEAILSMCELGLNYSCQGFHERAAKYQYSALGYPLTSPQAKLPSNICRMASIAIDLDNNSNSIEAEKIARDAVELARLHESFTQYQIVASLASLASVCGRLNKTEEAEKLYREAFAIMKSRTKIHKDLPSSMTSLASIFLQEARYKDAEDIASEAREKLSELPEPNIWTTIFNTRTLATAYAEQGRYHEAEILFSNILEQQQQQQSKTWKLENLTGSSIIGALSILENIARLYTLMEQYQQAERTYEKILAVKSQLRGPTHPQTLRITALYIDTINSQARYTEVLKLGLDCKARYEQEHKIRQDVFVEQMLAAHIDRVIATSYLGLGNYADAEPLACKALETSVRNLGPHHPQSLECFAVLARAFRDHNDKDKLGEAKEMEVRVLDGWISMVGETHLKTIRAMTALADTCDKQGNQEESETLRRKATVLRQSLDAGLDGEEKRKLDDLLLQTLRKWDENKDLIAAAVKRLKTG